MTLNKQPGNRNNSQTGAWMADAAAMDNLHGDGWSERHSYGLDAAKAPNTTEIVEQPMVRGDMRIVTAEKGFAPIASGEQITIPDGVDLPPVDRLEIMAELQLSEGLGEDGGLRVAIIRDSSPDAPQETLIGITRPPDGTNEGATHQVVGVLRPREGTDEVTITRDMMRTVHSDRSKQWLSTVSDKHLIITPAAEGFGAIIVDTSTNGTTLVSAQETSPQSAETRGGQSTLEVPSVMIGSTVEFDSEPGMSNSEPAAFRDQPEADVKRTEIDRLSARLDEVVEVIGQDELAMVELLDGVSSDDQLKIYRYASAYSRGDNDAGDKLFEVPSQYQEKAKDYRDRMGSLGGKRDIAAQLKRNIGRLE